MSITTVIENLGKAEVRKHMCSAGGMLQPKYLAVFYKTVTGGIEAGDYTGTALELQDDTSTTYVGKWKSVFNDLVGAADSANIYYHYICNSTSLYTIPDLAALLTIINSTSPPTAPSTATIRVATTTFANTAAYLTCGTAGSATYGDWAALTNTGKFSVTVDGTTLTDVNPDFTGDTSMANVAASIGVALNAGLAGTTCTWSTDHFVITSPTTGGTSSITYLSAPGSGTDLSSNSWMTGLLADGAATTAQTSVPSVTAGAAYTAKFQVTVS